MSSLLPLRAPYLWVCHSQPWTSLMWLVDIHPEVSPQERPLTALAVSDFVRFGKSSWNFNLSESVCTVSSLTSVGVYALTAVEEVSCFVRCEVEVLFNNISFLLILSQTVCHIFVLCRWTRHVVVVVAVNKMKNGAEEQDAEWVLRGTRKMAFLVKLSWKLCFVGAHCRDGRHG